MSNITVESKVFGKSASRTHIIKSLVVGGAQHWW